jgi:hypothetical protein
MTILTLTTMESKADLEELCSMSLPLIRIQFKGKRPIDNEWVGVKHFDRKAPDFYGINVGVKCDQLQNGKWLSILDVDEQNGGWESFSALIYELDSELPPTFVVKTGQGGAHFYFLTDEPLPKCKLAQGIDFQGVGSYCVGPGSTHENGKMYHIDSGDPIAEMPATLQKLIRSRSTPFFEGRKHFGEMEKIGKGGRHNYIVQVAGLLRRGGLSVDAIYAALLKTNAEKCEPPLPDKEIAAVSKGVERYDPSHVYAKAETEAPTKKSAERVIKPNSLTDQAFSDNLESRAGLVFEIAKHILDFSDRKYPQIAIAVAEAIIGACAQGGFVSPPISDGAAGASLTLYQWIVAPSAAGKDSYRHAITAYLEAVDKRLIFSKAGSTHGFFSQFFKSNSGCFIEDEFQDFLDQVYGKGTTNHLRQIEPLLKECYNDLDVLQGLRLARSKYPDIQMPRLSIFGLGTIAGYQKHLTGTAIAGGLMSRFAVIPTMTVPDRTSIGRRVTPLPEHVDALVDIVRRGMTMEGTNQGDGESELDRFYKSMEKGGSPAKHYAQFACDSVKMTISPDARARLMEIFAEKERQYKGFLAKNLADCDTSPGSIVDRSPRFVLKRATIAAIGRGSIQVELGDIEVSNQFVNLTTNWVLNQVQGNAGSNENEKLVNKLVGILKKSDSPMTKKEIFAATNRNYSKRQLDEAIEFMAVGGLLTVYADRSGHKTLMIEDKVPTVNVFFGKCD